MPTLLLLLGVSFSASFLLTPLVRRVAIRCHLVDRPDGRRKMQSQAIPVAGGLIVFLVVTGTLAAFSLVTNPLQGVLEEHRHDLLGLLLAATVICLVGVADDYGWLRGRHKLLGQLLAIAVVLSFGLEVRSIRLFEWQVDLGLLAIPFTFFWLLGAINSLNLIDGMDGLLSSVGLIVALAMAVMALLGDKWGAACVAVALAGSLLGFLRYNFPPASIFLGDSGSMLIGLIVGVVGIRSSLKGTATIGLAAPVAMMTIPAFDTLAAILRRKLTGRSIYDTDRSHLHHCLLGRGLSSRWVLLAISSFCLLTVLGALATLAFNNEFIAILTSLAVIAGLIVSRLFGYAEFLLVRNRLVHLVRSLLSTGHNRKPHHVEVHMQGTAEWKELLDALVATAASLNLTRIRLDVNAPSMHEGYHGVWDCGGEELQDLGLWHTDFPLFLRGQIVARLEIVGTRSRKPIGDQIAAVEEMVDRFEKTLTTRGEAAAGINSAAHSVLLKRPSTPAVNLEKV